MAVVKERRWRQWLCLDFGRRWQWSNCVGKKLLAVELCLEAGGGDQNVLEIVVEVEVEVERGRWRC